MTSHTQRQEGREIASATEAFSRDAREALALRVALALRAGRRIADTHFDCFLPSDLRIASSLFWTPLEVAARAAEWLTELRIRTVVDIGSGVGKFCIAAALATECSFTGIEQRQRLASGARGLARLFNVDSRVQFVTGVFGKIAVPAADCYYLFNPFGENLFDPDERLDDVVELSPARYLDDIAAARQHLASVPLGTYVMTYNGFGGTLSDDFDEVRIDVNLRCVLRMARRERFSG